MGEAPEAGRPLKGLPGLLLPACAREAQRFLEALM